MASKSLMLRHVEISCPANPSIKGRYPCDSCAMSFLSEKTRNVHVKLFCMQQEKPSNEEKSSEKNDQEEEVPSMPQPELENSETVDSMKVKCINCNAEVWNIQEHMLT